jgi:diguanylate cyclase (GGDEF)-like protein/PAS domain S-box-containing protein
MTDGKKLRVLIVEDSEDDALLALRELKRGGIDAVSERVFTADGLKAALSRQDWDVVIADHNMPGFDSADAIRIVRELGVDIPLIIVSGSIGEELAVALMKSGAHDFIMKHNLARLVPAVERELREAINRREQRNTEAALLASERHFRAYFEKALIGMASTSAEKGWLEVNDALCRMLGYAREELMRMNWAELTHPDDLKENLKLYERILSGEIDSYTIENRLIRKDGQAIHVRRAPQAVRKADGSIDYIVAIIEDITERRRAEHNERLRNHVLELLTLGKPLAEILNAIVRGVEADNPGMLCSILLLNENRLTIGAAPSLPALYNAAIDGAEIGPEAGSCGTACYTGERIIVEDIDSHPYWKNYKHLAEQAGLVSCWSEPIYGSTRKVLGSFAIYHRNPSIPNNTDIALIASCARLVGVSLERKRAEDELQLASMVYNNSSEAMMITDEKNRIIAINPAFTDITGYTPEEVSGRNPGLLKSGKHDEDFYRNLWREVQSRGTWHGQIWNRRKSGEIYPEWLTINTIYNPDGSVHRHVALFSDITDKVRTDKLIWRQANFDLLTDLPNRRMLHDRLEQEIKKAHRAKSRLALLFIDLDRFKEVNDTLGHQLGDRLLIEAAHRIVSCVRESDTVARLGGDEFTIVLSELPDGSHVEKIAQLILEKLAAPFLLGTEQAYVSASIGITFYPDDALDVEQLLRNADQAMYLAKNAGRNRLGYFTSALQERAQLRLRMLNDLRGALAANQFALYFQPVIDLATGKIIKAEALLRWNHPVRGMVSPMDFIPLAEESGLIIEIGAWVFMEAARWISRWVAHVPDNFQISVNESPVQFQNDDNSMDKWLTHLSELGLSGKHFVIEITEGLLLNADASITNKLLKFRDAGIEVAIDDFGTGYSSLSYLKKLDIDYLKIDKSFVQDIASDASDLALSEAIVMMAHKLGLKVIAEGVETQAQRDRLIAAGCDYAQGYLFSKPIPPEEFELLLKNSI